jgi:hypothetical protein
MSDYTEMSKRSLSFRRISSNLLQSEHETADVNLARFVKFIDEDTFISKWIHDAIDNLDYDFKDCFPVGNFEGWAEVSIPVEEACHLKAQYDYLHYILALPGDHHVLGQGMRYLWQSRNFDDIVRNFIEMAFKPMINSITDAMSMEMITMKENEAVPATMNIGTVNGNAILQTGEGTINATANITNESKELVSLIDRLLPELEKLQGTAPADDIESVKDDLEVLKEQAQSKEPKPSRMKKALAGIKNFGKDVLVKLAVSLTSTAILQTDWPVLIQQAETFISGYLN